MMMMSRTTRAILIMPGHSGAWWWLSNATHTHKCATEWVSGVLENSPLSSFTFFLLLSFSLFCSSFFLFFLFSSPRPEWWITWSFFGHGWTHHRSSDELRWKERKKEKIFCSCYFFFSLYFCTLPLQVSSIYPLLLRTSVRMTSFYSWNAHRN